MLKWVQERAESYVSENWHSPLALLVASVVLAGGCIAFFARLDLTALSLLEWVFTGIAVGALSFVWWLTTRRVAKTPKGKLGFGVAISYEDARYGKELRQDFLLAIRDLLQGTPLSHGIHFNEFGPHIADRLDDLESARKLLDRSRTHFLIWGRARQRDSSKGPVHRLDIHGMVKHARVPIEVSRALAEEFNQVLPQHLTISKRDDVVTLPLTAFWIDTSTRYIVGIAALISGDLDFAEELLSSAETRLTQPSGHELPSLNRSKVREKLAALYEVRLTKLGNLYGVKRDKKYLEQCEPVLAKLEDYMPDSYSARLQRAIGAFVLRRDIEKARSELAACHSEQDITWRYSEAFLFAYEGHLDAAYDAYKKAFSRELADETVPIQSEQFIEGVLDEEPEKYWLYFALGMINHRAKRDFVAAKRDFGRFCEQAEPGRFAVQVEAVRRWVTQLDAQAADEGK